MGIPGILSEEQLRAMGMAPSPQNIPQNESGIPPIVQGGGMNAPAPTGATVPFDPSRALHTPSGVIDPIVKGGEISKDGTVADRAGLLAQQGLINNDLGKQAYHAGMPKIADITDDPESTRAYQVSRQNQLEYKQAHPWGSPVSEHPGILGKIGHVLGEIGSTIAPNIAANIPGSQPNLQRQEQEAIGGINQQTQLQNQTTEAGAQKMNAETASQREQAAEDQAAKPAGKEEEWAIVPGFTDAQGGPLIQEKHSGQVKPAGMQGAQQKPEKADDFEKFYKDYITDNRLPDSAHNRQLARKEWANSSKADKEEGPGSWSLQEDHEGKPVLFNSKTGAMKAAPEGIQRSGTASKAQAADVKNIEPIKAGLDYATNYLNNKVYTGPGDEALMEKFFELAKPSTGFRMSQPQMNMLNTARSWMGGLEGRARHAISGSYFSENQRKQIVDTMQQLGQSKLSTHAAGQPQAGGEAKPTHVYNPATGRAQPI